MLRSGVWGAAYVIAELLETSSIFRRGNCSFLNHIPVYKPISVLFFDSEESADGISPNSL